MTKYMFDEAIKVDFKGKNNNGFVCYTGELKKDWKILDASHGGYLVSVLLNAFTHHYKDILPHPIHISCNFINKCFPGEFEIEIKEINKSKKYSTSLGILKQRSQPISSSLLINCVYSTVIFGDLNLEKGISPPFYEQVPIPPRELCVTAPPNRVTKNMGKYIQLYVDLETNKKKRAELKTWATFTDDREVDLLSLGYFADVFFPPKHKLESKYVTMTLEIQFKNIPKGRWLAASHRSRFLLNGRNELDSELWDEEGNLLAIARQMGLLIPLENNK
nr:3681_t:CDS:2 [Entrophospora candida]